MNDQEDLVRKDYIAVRGTVAESYPGFIRLATEDGRQAGFKMDGPVQFQPGAPLRVVALRGTDQAVFLINSQTGERHRVHNWRGDSGSGQRNLSSALSVVTFLLLLIPLLGQLVALAGGIGALAGGAAASGMMQGYPRISFRRVVQALGVYFVGSFIYIVGFFGSNAFVLWLGFLILAAGAAGYAFWAKQPGIEYQRALDRFVDEVAA